MMFYKKENKGEKKTFLKCPKPAAAQGEAYENALYGSFELSAQIKSSKVFTLGQLVWEAATR